MNLKSLIYHHGIANSGYKDWDTLYEIYRNTSVASEKIKLLYGLSGSREPWVLRRWAYIFRKKHILLNAQKFLYKVLEMALVGKSRKNIPEAEVNDFTETVRPRWKTDAFIIILYIICRRVWILFTSVRPIYFEIINCVFEITTKKRPKIVSF